MELKNLTELKEEMNYLEEAEEMLRDIYYGFGPYEIRQLIRSHEKDFIGTDVNKLITKLENHFDFDDSE